MSAPPWVRAAQEAYYLDLWTWEAMRERETLGYLGSDEEADFLTEHPRPRFKEYMRQFSRECLTSVSTLG